MNHADSRSPEWLSADEPLPLEVLDAIRVADREDGGADQVARLEARLAPLFQAPHGAESAIPAALRSRAEPRASTRPSTSGSMSMLKLVSAGMALLGVAALMWPQREQASQRTQPRVASHVVERGPLASAPVVASLATAKLEPSVSSLARFEPALEHAPSPAQAAQPQVPTAQVFTVTARSGAEHVRSMVPQDTLALEARLLSRARRSLESAPEQALKLAERHQQRFPQGVLSEEREAIAIKALRGAGREALALQRQARFLARYPESPHAMSLAASTRP